MSQDIAEILKKIQANPKPLLMAAARNHFMNFARYMQPSMEVESFHRVLYEVLNLFAHGQIKKLMITLPPQHGKELSDSTPILTPSGFKRHGDLKIGDYVYGRDGQPVKVLWVSEKTISEYDVTFSDGSTIQCHGNHEWVVKTMFGEHTFETKQLYQLCKEEDFYVDAPHTFYFHNGKPLIGDKWGDIRHIVSVELAKNPEQGNCIQVEGGIYLAGETLIPTHNSEASSRKLPAFMLGLNPNLKIAIGSYESTTAQGFNKDVQRNIDSDEYRELFPKTFINGSGKQSYNNVFARNNKLCEIVGHRGSIVAVGRSGALTSKTVDIAIMDDLYKDYEEGNSPVIREKAWKWYTSVVKTRLHNDSQELMLFTRWHEDDIIGRLEIEEQVIEVKSISELKSIPRGAWVKINFEAIKDSEPTEIDPRQPGEALWENRHSKMTLEEKRSLDKILFDCLYQGKPASKEGMLYQSFKEYFNLQQMGVVVGKGNYTDVADEGDDFLCSVCYDLIRTNRVDDKGRPFMAIAITDILYTQDPVEKTSEEVPAMLEKNHTRYANIESNNGGKGFSIIIKKKTKAVISWFYQGGNKESRIITNAGLVMEHIYFPPKWQTRWPKFHSDLISFKRLFSANKHDDACFIAGTKIATLKGDKNIEDIRVGDWVISPNGISAVLNTGCTGTKKVISKIGLIGTPNHKIYNEKRWVALTDINENLISLLSFKSLLLWRYRILLNLMVWNISSWGRENIISASQMSRQPEGVFKDFILQFGNFITKKQYQKAIVFIIKMAILTITTSAIWSVYQFGNIYNYTLEKICQTQTMLKDLKRALLKIAIRLRFGINLLRERLGIERKLKVKGKEINYAFVNSVEINLVQPLVMLDSATITVEVNIEEGMRDFNMNPSVSFAERSLPHQRLSQVIEKEDSVVEVVQIEQEQKVYNITVSYGCYYANNVLVSNCDVLTGIVEKEILKSRAGKGLKRKN